MSELWSTLISATDAYTAVDSLNDIVATIAFYITVVVAAALAVYNVAIGGRDAETIAKARRTSVGIVVGYSVGVIAVLGTLKIILAAIDEKIDTKFWLVIGLFALVLVGVSAILMLKKNNFSATKWVTLAYAVVVVAYVVVLLVCFPAAKEKYEPLNKWLMYGLSVALVAAIAVPALLLDKPAAYDSRSITYAAVCIATSFALSYVKFFSLPQGGSITFASMLPLMLYAYMFGLRRGVIAGAVYGLLQFIQSPQYYEPMQALLDYPIAFASIGMAGIGRKLKFLRRNTTAEFCVGATIAVLYRYAAHVLSGYFVFNSWAEYWGDWYGAHPLAYSFAYNAFMFVELAVLLIVGVLMLQSKSVRRMLHSISDANEATAAAQA